MGPNVAGVIGTAMATGALLALLGRERIGLPRFPPQDPASVPARGTGGSLRAGTDANSCEFAAPLPPNAGLGV